MASDLLPCMLRQRNYCHISCSKTNLLSFMWHQNNFSVDYLALKQLRCLLYTKQLHCRLSYIKTNSLSVTVGQKFFRTRPGRPWGPPGLQCNWYRDSFPEVKRPGRGIKHPLPCSADVKERAEIYLYSPSEHSWPVLGRNVPFVLLYKKINCSTVYRA